MIRNNTRKKEEEKEDSGERRKYKHKIKKEGRRKKGRITRTIEITRTAFEFSFRKYN